MISFQNIGYMGRLGNQMFQFASTIGIGTRKGYEIKFPVENCSAPQGTGPIDVKTGNITPVKCDLLDCFDIPDEYFIPSSDIEVHYLFNETRFEYDLNVESIPDGTVLNGYYQSEKYFLDIKEKIKKIFSFREEISKEGDRILKDISEGKKLISIHVRRGDYTLYPDHHPTCDPSYYTKCLEEIKKLGEEDLRIVVFSDDKEWCLNNMGNYIGEDFELTETENPYVELYIMTRCEYHIIANSSFSWWGSWLSDSKLTIAPSRWFGPLIPKNTEDVYCKNWIKI